MNDLRFHLRLMLSDVNYIFAGVYLNPSTSKKRSLRHIEMSSQSSVKRADLPKSTPSR